MRILLLSFYFTPDLSAGSFRCEALVRALLEHENVELHVVSTLPNRYASFSSEAPQQKKSKQLYVDRIKLPAHSSGIKDQVLAFREYYKQARQITKNENYDLVVATSSRLFTAYLGAKIAKQKKLPLYLDIRDIFVDTIKDVLSPKISLMAKPCLSLVEKLTINQADHVNLVSQGFKEYFQSRYPTKSYSYYTNGIDDAFMDYTVEVNPSGDIKTILYAGNIGEGQGLHTIIPEIARKLGSKFQLRVIGDGGRKELLQIKAANLTNVTLLPPVKREKLLKEYASADVLFLHLNDYPAFRKVLPSKIFEYAAMGKPIWAGVAGFPAHFLQSEVSNCAVFSPSNAQEALDSFATLTFENTERLSFKNKFGRGEIMKNMVADILRCGVKEKT